MTSPRQNVPQTALGRRPDTGEPIATAVFDLGAVLIDWDPRYLYRSLFADAAEMEHFLATICTPDWNAEQDRGRSLADGTAALIAEHPEHADLIEAYYGRWDEMVGQPITGTVEAVEYGQPVPRPGERLRRPVRQRDQADTAGL